MWPRKWRQRTWKRARQFQRLVRRGVKRIAGLSHDDLHGVFTVFLDNFMRGAATCTERAPRQTSQRCTFCPSSDTLRLRGKTASHYSWNSATEVNPCVDATPPCLRFALPTHIHLGQPQLYSTRSRNATMVVFCCIPMRCVDDACVCNCCGRHDDRQCCCCVFHAMVSGTC